MNTKSKQVAYCAVLIALAMMLSYIEVLIPFSFGIPGMKLGLANLVVVVGLYWLRPQEVFMISMIRIILMGYLFGNGVSILYSLAGGLLSFFAMVLVKQVIGLSKIGVSIVGGIIHNFGQLIVAIYVVQNRKLMFYMPALLIAGLITGALIGIIASKILLLQRRTIE